MKKLNILLVTLLVSSVTLINAQKISKQDAENLVQSYYTDEMEVYISKTLVPSGQAVKTIYTDETAPNYDSWLVFIDEQPIANWWHNCKYIFVTI